MTTIQIANLQDNYFATSGLEGIDLGLLSSVTGGKDNFLQRWGNNMVKGGEAAMAAGAVGTVVPVLGETGIPEAVAAGGGAAWLLGKGTHALGGLFK